MRNLSNVMCLFLLAGCIDNDCIPSATCNDETFQFNNDKCELCKATGIKYYYPCKEEIVVYINC
jgi:hypothetical protein